MGIMQRKKAILLNEPHIASESGNPISFKTDMKGLMGCRVNFSPVQSGSGDPSPSNVRPITGTSGVKVEHCGKNLFDKTTGIALQQNNLRVARNEGYGVPFHLKKGVTYTLSCNSSTRPSGILIQPPFSGDTIANVSNAYSFTYTPAEDVDIGINFYWANGRPSDATDIQIELGSTASPYTPYTGTSYSVTFPATGKNLFDEVYTDISTSIKYKPIYVGDSAVTLSTDNPEVLQGVANLFLLAGDVSSGASSGTNGVWANNPKTATPVDGYVTIAYRAYSGTTSPTQSHTQLEKGQTPTSYEPYTNTVYGGSLDVVTGELTVTHAGAILGKSDFGEKQTGTAIPYRQSNTIFPICDSGTSWSKARTQQLFNYGKIANPYSESSFGDYVGVVIYQTTLSTSNSYVRISEAVYEAMGDNDKAVISYVLAEPLTYQLTPQQLKSLKGDNSIWSDANGILNISFWKH